MNLRVSANSKKRGGRFAENRRARFDGDCGFVHVVTHKHTALEQVVRVVCKTDVFKKFARDAAEINAGSLGTAGNGSIATAAISPRQAGL